MGRPLAAGARAVARSKERVGRGLVGADARSSGAREASPAPCASFAHKSSQALTLLFKRTVPVAILQIRRGEPYAIDQSRVQLRSLRDPISNGFQRLKKIQKKLTVAERSKGTRPQPLLGAYGAR